LQQYAVLLPLRFNDGTPVPEELFLKTHRELLDRFGTLSIERGEISGCWTHEDITYRDSLQRVVIVDSDDIGSEEFFRQYKEVLKERFQPIEIWITVQPIRVIQTSPLALGLDR
jgi:hypothetical protein